LEIIEGLRGHISGLGIPTYVVDGLHGAGKIPLMPNYLVSASDNAVVLRNYEGLLFRYAPEDKARTQPATRSVGVSNLLSGDGKLLMPEGNVRMARRRQHSGLWLDQANGSSCSNGHTDVHLEVSYDSNGSDSGDEPVISEPVSEEPLLRIISNESW
jgi:lysine 2,3-aminomutase